MAIAAGSLSRPGSVPDCAALLMAWREEEIIAAQGRFGWLSRHDLEEMYDETADVLRIRTAGYEDELHLRKQLLLGLRWRATRRLRDRTRHGRIVEEHAQELHRDGEERGWEADPERALLAAEDQIVVAEFVADLTEDERPVFVLMADGYSWRAIATLLDVAPTTVRNLKREVEKKRDRFLALFESGRLCGYRSRTIEQLITGGEANDIAVRQAVAHLRHCRECKLTHQLTGEQLHARFSDSAAALLPVPLLGASHASAVDRAWLLLERLLRLLERFFAAAPSRERVVEVTVGGAAASKTAVAVVGAIAVLATGVTAGIRVVSPGEPRGAPHNNTIGVSAQGAAGFSPLISTQALGGLGHWDVRRRQVARRVPAKFGPGRVVGRERGPGEVISSGSGSENRGESDDPGAPTGSEEVPLRPVQDTAAPLSESSASSRPHVHQVGGGGFTP